MNTRKPLPSTLLEMGPFTDAINTNFHNMIDLELINVMKPQSLTIPELKPVTSTMQHPSRTMAEVELVSTHFGPVEYEDNEVLVKHFDLPSGYNKKYSRLLIILSWKHPEYPPTTFYLDKGLYKRRRQSEHYFEEYDGKEYCSHGFAWYCLHIKKWRPNANSMIQGDNLLTAIEAVYRGLKTD